MRAIRLFLIAAATCVSTLPMDSSADETGSTAAIPAFDHHDPSSLNETALRYLKVGAGGTALILLERAAVIDPGNPIIRENLATLHAHLAKPGQIVIKDEGVVVPPPAPGEPAGSPGMDTLPSLWQSNK